MQLARLDGKVSNTKLIPARAIRTNFCSTTSVIQPPLLIVLLKILKRSGIRPTADARLLRQGFDQEDRTPHVDYG
jgi:hypothetical protein